MLSLIAGWVSLAGARVVRGQQTKAAGVGTVTGTALGIGARATSPPLPLAGVELVLVPRSDEVLANLERVKSHARDSMAAYRAAMPEMRQIVEVFVRNVRGTGDLLVIPRASVDDTGRFTLDAVPSGDWILFGRRSVYIDRAQKDTRKETGIYQAQPRLVGYERVTVWLQTVTVEPGAVKAVELTDRNVWFEGVEEKTAARDRVGTPSRRSDR
jgi:hypothetical protein